MKIRGIGRARKAYRRAVRYFKPAALILMYHRIADVPLDPRGTAVSPGRFAEHLEYLNRTCYPMRLSELVDQIQGRSLPRRGVIVTFDDGYLDNLTQAYPLLASAQIPATVFVTTGRIGQLSAFWWDLLDRLFLLSQHLPEVLQLSVKDLMYEWPTVTPAERQRAFQAVHDLFQSASSTERDRMMTSLLSWASIADNEVTEDRPMMADELLQLTQDGLIEVGAHTVTHPVLASLPLEEQRFEILESRQRLETILQRPVSAFAYPYGQSRHFGPEAVDIVRTAGFRMACTTIQGNVEPGDDPFVLHRCEIRDYDIKAFKRHLDYFFLE